MPSQIHIFLADELDISEEDAQRLLQSVVREIRDRAGSGAVRLPGLGTFQTDDERLYFEPAEDLARTVNEEYEGLEAESVPAPSADSDQESPRTDETEPVDGTDPQAEDASERSSETVPLFPFVHLPSPETRTEFSVRAVTEIAEIDEEAALSPSVWRAERPRASDVGAPDTEPRKTPSDRTGASRRRDRATSSRSTGIRLTVGLLALFLLAGAGWFIMDQQGILPWSQSTVTESNNRSSAPVAGANESPSPSSEGDPASESASDTVGTNASASQSASADDRAQPASARWTLVVASRTQKEEAESVADAYQSHFSEQPLSVEVLTGAVEGTTRYRVAVGQFQTREDAQTAMKRYSEELPTGVWLLQLQ